jgi:hypothetical protein
MGSSLGSSLAAVFFFAGVLGAFGVFGSAAFLGFLVGVPSWSFLARERLAGLGDGPAPLAAPSAAPLASSAVFFSFAKCWLLIG